MPYCTQPAPFAYENERKTTQYRFDPTPCINTSVRAPAPAGLLIDHERYRLLTELVKKAGRQGLNKYIRWLRERASTYSEGWSDYELTINYVRVDSIAPGRIETVKVDLAVEASLAVQDSARLHDLEEYEIAEQIRWLMEAVKC